MSVAMLDAILGISWLHAFTGPVHISQLIVHPVYSK
jgi:hypothetical protein